MDIKLVGGQYDGEWVNVGSHPMPYINMHPKLGPSTAYSPRYANPKATFDHLTYKLEKVWLSPQKWHYEYHYQGS